LPEAAASESEDECGLQFIDPEEEERERREAEAWEKPEKQKMIMVNGKLVPKASTSINSAAAGAQPGRFQMLKELKAKTLQNKSKNFDIAKL